MGEPANKARWMKRGSQERSRVIEDLGNECADTLVELIARIGPERAGRVVRSAARLALHEADAAIRNE